MAAISSPPSAGPAPVRLPSRAIGRWLVALGVALAAILVPIASLTAMGVIITNVQEEPQRLDPSDVHVVQVMDGAPAELRVDYEYTLIGLDNPGDTTVLDYTACSVAGPAVEDYHLLQRGTYEGHPFFFARADGAYTVTCGTQSELYVRGEPAGPSPLVEQGGNSSEGNVTLALVGILGGGGLILLGFLLVAVQSGRRSKALRDLAARGLTVPAPPKASQFPSGLAILALAGAGAAWLASSRAGRFGSEMWQTIFRVLLVAAPLVALAAAVTWAVTGARRDAAHQRAIAGALYR